MPEEKTNKPNWSKDKFTEMVKEYGDKIAKISEDVEKELQKMLEESQEVNLFLEKSDKKKVELKKVMEKVLNEQGTFSSIIAYDIGLGVMSEDEWKALDNMSTTILSEDDVEDDDSYDISGTSRPELSEHEMKAINKAANPYLTKFMEQTGKNLYDTMVSYITKGPGLTDFNIFKGVFELIRESLSEDFVSRLGRMYDKDIKFRQAYGKVVDILTKNGKNIVKNIDNLTNRIVGKTAPTVSDDSQVNNEPAINDITTFKALVNLICILLSENYKGLILREFKSKHSHSARAAQELNSFVDFVNSNVNKYSAKDFPRIVAQYYVENCSESNDINSIPSLLYMVSSAIAAYSMYPNKGSVVNKKTLKIKTKITDTKVVNDELQKMGDALRNQGITVNTDGSILYNKKTIDYLDFLNSLEDNNRKNTVLNGLKEINIQLDPHGDSYVDVDMFKQLLDGIIKDSTLSKMFVKSGSKNNA